MPKLNFPVFSVIWYIFSLLHSRAARVTPGDQLRFTARRRERYHREGRHNDILSAHPASEVVRFGSIHVQSIKRQQQERQRPYSRWWVWTPLYRVSLGWLIEIDISLSWCVCVARDRSPQWWKISYQSWKVQSMLSGLWCCFSCNNLLFALMLICLSI